MRKIIFTIVTAVICSNVFARNERALTIGQTHQMIYHTKMQKVILINGGPQFDNGSASSDFTELWEWTGSSWSLLNSEGPPWRNFFSVVKEM
jgi:hypothetical protein